MAGIYDIKEHYRHEASRATEHYSTMSRAMYDDENNFDNFSPLYVLENIPANVKSVSTSFSIPHFVRRNSLFRSFATSDCRHSAWCTGASTRRFARVPRSPSPKPFGREVPEMRALPSSSTATTSTSAWIWWTRREDGMEQSWTNSRRLSRTSPTEGEEFAAMLVRRSHPKLASHAFYVRSEPEPELSLLFWGSFVFVTIECH